ncbi:glutamine--fructose-6-phosphate transaminase (isomerizing) [Caldivirga maquilingensis]|uniref:glutamine--fructose-6-phosphate transaminase (isomerizing) n=1 Tax=Caldivirga maquilingensis (strain ATCC 700844 / DSM 13496 / JCM 10307 / IC-167) TaxID=397948 RepID=A8MC94_CALMQ|nr:glutamine--fructose-6-phosphate transaminase (isomerizing) [Caldivirga maquilingensis]ABW01400.1 glutamine amidotransferase class-II [Caldivirga maquilingensis IC-167]
MGGIFGLVSNIRPVAPVIRIGLERLMHRGIDGAGIATVYNSVIHIKKDAGKVTDVHSKLNLDDLPGYVGIGHVRSATHGRPVYENTHPVQDCTGGVALVMDGVVSDYDEIRRRLSRRHKLVSRTDAEALAHIIEDELKDGKSMREALSSVTRQVKGYYTIAVLNKDEERIYALSMGNPLVIGVSDREYFVSSEEQAIPVKLRLVYFMEPNQMVVMSKDGVEFYDASSMSKVEPSPQLASQTTVEVVKGSFQHYMIKEIYEEPEVLARAVNVLQREYLDDAASIVAKAKNIIFTGSGTSYYASLIGKYYLEELGGVKADAIPAGEFPYLGVRYVEPGTLIIAISQSGESTDIIRTIRWAKRKGAIVLSIVNRLGSALMRESNVYLPMGAGPELAVPATKSFVASIAIMLQLAYAVKGNVNDARSLINKAIIMLNNQINKVRDDVRRIAKLVSNYNNAYIISGGPIGLPLAMEAALKLKEAAQVHSEAFSFREFKHGPITLISKEFPTIAIMPGNDVDDEIINVISEVWSRGGYTVVITQEGKEVTGDQVIYLERMGNRLIIPLVYPAVIQLLAYEIGVARGIDVDNPHNLSKVVTT